METWYVVPGLSTFLECGRVFCLPVRLHPMRVVNRLSDPLDLELQTVVSHHVEVGT